jgi:hypothetical protein
MTTGSIVPAFLAATTAESIRTVPTTFTSYAAARGALGVGHVADAGEMHDRVWPRLGYHPFHLGVVTNVSRDPAHLVQFLGSEDAHVGGAARTREPDAIPPGEQLPREPLTDEASAAGD